MAGHASKVVLEAIVKALIDILAGAGEPFDEVKKEKERLEEVQLEILRNAPTVGRTIKLLPPGRPPPRGGRLRQISPWTFAVIDEEVVGEDAAGEEEAEREGE